MQVFKVYDVGGQLRALFLDHQEAQRYAATNGWLIAWVEPTVIQDVGLWRAE